MRKIKFSIAFAPLYPAVKPQCDDRVKRGNKWLGYKKFSKQNWLLRVGKVPGNGR
jgi:hypothetical protein